MKGRIGFGMLQPDTNIYLWILGISFVIIAYYNLILGALGLLLLIYLISYNLRLKNKKKEELRLYIEKLSDSVDNATKKRHTEFTFPFGDFRWRRKH